MSSAVALLRARGLKQYSGSRLWHYAPVALLRARGLKQIKVRQILRQIRSVALLRARGLKLLCAAVSAACLCRALASAWVETVILLIIYIRVKVALLRARGLKHVVILGATPARCRRALASAWVETRLMVNSTKLKKQCRALASAWVETVRDKKVVECCG